MTQQILCFRPVKLDPARGLEGAEWSLLVAPSQRDFSVTTENVVSQARFPLPNAIGTNPGEPRESGVLSALTDSQARAKSVATPPTREALPSAPATFRQQMGTMEIKGSEKSSEPPTGAAPTQVYRPTLLEPGVRQNQESQAQQDAAAKVPSPKTSIARPNDADSGAAAQPTRSVASAESFIPRSEVAGAQKYRELQQLRRDVTAAAPGSERAKINQSIRKIRDAAYKPGRLTNNYCDIDGNPIGMVQVISKGQVPRDCIAIAATDTVSSIAFDFVERRVRTLADRTTRREIVDETKLALRFTAIISEQGREVLEKLAKQIVKNSPYQFGIRLQKGREESVPKTEIKRILRDRKSFDTTIDAIPIHISTNGKVELHTSVASMRLVTVNELCFPRSKDLHRTFTPFSRSPKKWVLRTSNELNEVVKNGFERLAQVLNRIFE